VQRDSAQHMSKREQAQIDGERRLAAEWASLRDQERARDTDLERMRQKEALLVSWEEHLTLREREIREHVSFPEPAPSEKYLTAQDLASQQSLAASIEAQAEELRPSTNDAAESQHRQRLTARKRCSAAPGPIGSDGVSMSSVGGDGEERLGQLESSSTVGADDTEPESKRRVVNAGLVASFGGFVSRLTTPVVSALHPRHGGRCDESSSLLQVREFDA